MAERPPPSPFDRPDVDVTNTVPDPAVRAAVAVERENAVEALAQLRRAEELRTEALHHRHDGLLAAAATAAALAATALAAGTDAEALAARDPDAKDGIEDDGPSETGSSETSSGGDGGLSDVVTEPPPEMEASLPPELAEARSDDVAADEIGRHHHHGSEGPRDGGPAEVGVSHPEATPWNGQTTIGTISYVDGDRVEQYTGRGTWTSLSVAGDLGGVVPEVGESVQINRDGSISATPEQQMSRSQGQDLDLGRSLPA